MAKHPASSTQQAEHQSTLAFKQLTIYFQRFPGKHGTEADRGIAQTAYKVRHNQRLVAKGETAPDGAITILVPEGEQVEIEAFGTQYKLNLLESLEMKTSTKGQQQRLSLLGYEPGPADDILRKETDIAALQFQADTDLDPKGSMGKEGIDEQTYERLAKEFGE